MINNNIKTFTAKIAKFKRMEALNKDLCLLLDVYILNQKNNTKEFFRKHLWIDVSSSKRIKLDKTKQGCQVLFYGKVYEYINSTLKTQKGIEIKFPQYTEYYKYKIKEIK